MLSWNSPKPSFAQWSNCYHAMLMSRSSLMKLEFKSCQPSGKILTELLGILIHFTWYTADICKLLTIDPSSSEIEIIFLWDFRKDCTSFIVPMDFQNSHFSFLVVAFQFARRERRRKLPQPFELAAVKNNQARWQFYYIITMVANTINGEKKTYQIWRGSFPLV